MQLITILLVTVSILTVLSGLAVFCGAARKERARSAWFFLATIFAAIWTDSIALFLNATSEMGDLIPVAVNLTFISALFFDVGLIGYLSWQRKSGKIFTLLLSAVAIILALSIAINPGLLYKQIILSDQGNSIELNLGGFYIAYAVFTVLKMVNIVTSSILTMIESSKAKRKGYLVLLIGYMAAGLMMLIFNMILTFTRWDLIWVGPISISTTIICFYLAVLRFKMVSLNTNWLRMLSYVVLMLSGAVFYMVIFALVFRLLFRGASPSIEVIVLNFIMIAIVLLMFPAMNELTALVEALVASNQIDLGYIMKKLSRVAPKDADLEDIARFLAFHMHFSYIGFLVNGRIYESEKSDLSEEALREIAGYGEPEDGLWQAEANEVHEIDGKPVYGVAALRGADGKYFGQMIFGKQTSKTKLSWQDQVKIETIVNLVAVIIDSKERVKK